MTELQFRLRTLFAITTISAILALPVYELGLSAIRFWNRKNESVAMAPTFNFVTVTTTVSMPRGGTVLITGSGIRTIKSEGTRWLQDGQLQRFRRIGVSP